jgi:proteasome assembly chaperone (PAC2) family protein
MSKSWELRPEGNLPVLKKTIFIEGLPGIGNVGKVVIDFLIEKSAAKKVMSFFSYSLPNSVFVNEDNLVELPKIELYHARIKGQDYLFLTGDVQPTEEEASYTFCETILTQASKNWNVSSLITLGGIGLEEEPEEPEVYCTGNDKAFIEQYTAQGARNDIYHMVGPIIGVSGLLLGLAKEKNIPAITLLAETYGHPMHLGLRGAKSTLTILMKELGMNYKLSSIEEELEEQESGGDAEVLKNHPKLSTINKLKRKPDINYIG